VPTVTALIITKNEEANITDCLASLDWAAERLVIDAESTDRTVELARAAGADVTVRPWPGFGPQKNFGMDRARSDWILIVDADERVPVLLAEEIRSLLSRWKDGDPVAYEIPRMNFYYGAWVRHGGLYPDYQIRLVRKGTAAYNDVPVHENLTSGSSASIRRWPRARRARRSGPCVTETSWLVHWSSSSRPICSSEGIGTASAG